MITLAGTALKVSGRPSRTVRKYRHRPPPAAQPDNNRMTFHGFKDEAGVQFSESSVKATRIGGAIRNSQSDTTAAAATRAMTIVLMAIFVNRMPSGFSTG